MRFDFSFDRKVTREELDQVAAIVNEAIEKQIEVIMEELPLKDAYESGAIGVFSGKYGDIVKVYTIPGYSKEICGGPHCLNSKMYHIFISADRILYLIRQFHQMSVLINPPV